MGFQQGLSGLNASSKNLEIIGNNVANANTYGTKVARGEFSDVYAAALSGAGTQAIGIGTNLAAVAQQFTQGNITTTSNPMDLAINGAGFFQVSDGNSPVSYTRNGQFKVDREGYIVNNAAQRLLGYPADGVGNIQAGQAGAIRLPTGGIEPRLTQEISIELNLESSVASTNPTTVAVELAQDTADGAAAQGATALLAMDDALDAVNLVTNGTPETAAAQASVAAAGALVTTASTTVAAMAAGYASATQTGAETAAAGGIAAVAAAKAAAQTAMTDVSTALGADPSNSELITAQTLLQDALVELDSLLSNAEQHEAAVDAVPGAMSGPAINFSDPDTFNYTTSMKVYDAKGQEVGLNYYFQKSGTDTWNVFGTANGTSVAGSDSSPQPISTLVFSSDGSRLLSPTAPISFNVPASVNDLGADTMAITGVTLDLSGASQFGSPSGVTDVMQDGFAAGQLTSIAVEANGIVTARYSNGMSRAAGQVEIATFRNPQGLQPIGDNGWARTFASGDPVVGVPGEGNLGKLQAGALEESNVDITGELVNMITAQRIYQANAQSIKTIDQVMQTIVNLR
ncbi:MAG: flagellar hook protein FlgE [Burkholderiaceae bacterium]|nr:flagellar hook protein FlgE [Rhodoferax sp.]MCP5286187.1 flagellar hook protein FlgE [Burkholderiaceae bacterium]